MQVYGNNLIQPSIKNVGKSDTQSKPVQQNNSETAFQNILQNKILGGQEALQFSRHANMRLNARDINLSDEQLQRVESAINTAKEKGIRDSLVLVDDVALVVNIKSKVVITAMNQGNDNVFTNIDGAVIV